ncbi:MAG: DNA-directed RNA polymerase subunit omega, partial [Peptococcaceae bacterium]|nr:DNA-directed RNA polymerase subunit omega [Peptococcaceae bacterium]
MRQPSIDKLLKQMDSKYGLVVAAAKRAREITDGAKPVC